MLLLAGQSAYAVPGHVRADGRALLDVIQSALVGEETMSSIVSRLIEAAIALSPGTTRQIVKAALNSGADAIDVANQCLTALTLPEVKAVIGASMAERADVETILSICLTARPIEYAADLLAAALAEAPPDLYDEIISVGYRILEDAGSDWAAVLVDGVMQGEILSGDEFGQDPGLALEYVNDVVSRTRRSSRRVTPPVIGNEPASSPS